MVDMSHHNHNRRALFQRGFFILILFQQLLNHIHRLLLLADNIVVNGNIFCFLIRELGIHRHDLPRQKQLFDNCGRLDMHLICKFLDCKLIRNGNYFNLFLRLFCLLYLRFNETSSFLTSGHLFLTLIQIYQVLRPLTLLFLGWPALFVFSTPVFKTALRFCVVISLRVFPVCLFGRSIISWCIQTRIFTGARAGSLFLVPSLSIFLASSLRIFCPRRCATLSISFGKRFVVLLWLTLLAALR